MTNNSDDNLTKLASSHIKQVALLFAGGGLLGSIYLLIKKSRNIVYWIIAIVLMVSGAALVLKGRQEGIKQTGDLIIAQIDGLDPIAKAQVAKYVADQEIGKFSW